MQIDYIIADSFFDVIHSWCDLAVAVGLDHRVSHSVLAFNGVSRSQKQRRRKQMTGWVANVDDQGMASEFQAAVCARMPATGLDSFAVAEEILHKAAVDTGRVTSKRKGFKPSVALAAMRTRRRRTEDQAERRDMSKSISRFLRNELRAWRSTRLQDGLGDTSCWKALRLLREIPQGKRKTQQPHPDDFASEFHQCLCSPTYWTNLTSPLKSCSRQSAG